jgi:hypothetical protein
VEKSVDWVSDYLCLSRRALPLDSVISTEHGGNGAVSKNHFINRVSTGAVIVEDNKLLRPATAEMKSPWKC